jgi:CRP/FNR family cyclic AMP-dependent transcriptional regulator
VTFTGVPTGGWFGEGSLLKAEPRKYGAMALRESRIARMPKSTFEWLLDNSIAFNRFVLLQINERLGQFIALVGFGRLLDTDARIARCLGALFNSILYPGAGLRLSISQEEYRLPERRVAAAGEPGASETGARGSADGGVRWDSGAGLGAATHLRLLIPAV